MSLRGLKKFDQKYGVTNGDPRRQGERMKNGLDYKGPVPIVGKQAPPRQEQIMLFTNAFMLISQGAKLTIDEGINVSASYLAHLLAQAGTAPDRLDDVLAVISSGIRETFANVRKQIAAQGKVSESPEA